MHVFVLILISIKLSIFYKLNIVFVKENVIKNALFLQQRSRSNFIMINVSALKYISSFFFVLAVQISFPGPPSF